MKNSWTASWGFGGYVYIARSSLNVCGVLSEALYPNLVLSTNAPSTMPSIMPTIPGSTSSYSGFVTTTGVSFTVNSLPVSDARLITFQSASLSGSLFGGKTVSAVATYLPSFSTNTSAIWSFSCVYAANASSSASTYSTIIQVIPNTPATSSLWIYASMSYVVPFSLPISPIVSETYAISFFSNNSGNNYWNVPIATKSTDAGFGVKGLIFYYATPSPTLKPTTAPTSPSSIPTTMPSR